MKSLYEAFAEIKTEKEFSFFLKDLCTPQEIKDLSERWRIAQLLFDGSLSYREIARQVGVSITTVTRVARFLKDESHQGYAHILNRIHHHA